MIVLSIMTTTDLFWVFPRVQCVHAKVCGRVIPRFATHERHKKQQWTQTTLFSDLSLFLITPRQKQTPSIDTRATENDIKTTQTMDCSSPQPPEDLGGSSSSEVAPDPAASVATIAKEDLIELIRAVKFKNPDFSQRQVYTEIVTEIPTKFPQYAVSLNPDTLCLNDVKKAWKKAILQQQKQPPTSGSNTNSSSINNDLAERLRAISSNPEVYTVGLNDKNNTEDLPSTGSSMARDYVARFLEEQQAETSAQQRRLLEDYVHVFLDVPADSSVSSKPHQALINFQAKGGGTKKSSSNNKAAKGTNNKKKQRGKKKGGSSSATVDSKETTATPPSSAPFEDAIIVKIQMAAPIDEHDTARHPMLLYDKTRTYKTFVHPDGILAAEEREVSSSVPAPPASVSNAHDGYSRLAHWIRNEGVGGALGASGGTKAYFYGRLTKAAAKSNQILSIYVKELAPTDAQEF